MKTAISIPDRVFAAVDKTAKRLGLSRSALFARAAEVYVRQLGQDHIRQTLDLVYAEQPSTLDPSLDLMQVASLPRERW